MGDPLGPKPPLPARERDVLRLERLSKHGTLERVLAGLESARTPKEKLPLLWHFSQLVSSADDRTIRRLAEQLLSAPEPAYRGEMCYGLGRLGKEDYLLLVRRCLADVHPRVRREAARAERRIIEATTSGVLDELLRLIESTRSHLSDEHGCHQLLTSIRLLLRKHVFDYFAEGSAGRSLVAAIINATNRTVASSVRKEYLEIFRDCLNALQRGTPNDETVTQLKTRLLEIDDQ